MTTLGNIDTSCELQVYRSGNGIKLINPTEAKYHRLNSFMHDTHHTVDSILKLPLSVYFIDADSNNANINENDAGLCGFDSVSHAIGKKCFSKFTKASADITTQNDNHVMLQEKIKISEENVVLSSGLLQRPTLSIKMPWYNHDNNVIGIFGCSIILGKHPLAESLAVVSNLGLLNKFENPSHYIGGEINKKYLSKRQMACAKLLLKGLTYKEIALSLHLSPRTIETYIDNLKLKLNCSNRTELILNLTKIIQSQE